MAAAREQVKIKVENEPSDGRTLEASTRRFLRSALRAGLSVAALPVNLLPQATRQHVTSAGRELTQGAASLVRAVADTLDEIAEEPARTTRR